MKKSIMSKKEERMKYMKIEMPVIHIIDNVMSEFATGDVEKKILAGAFLKGKRKNIRFILDYGHSYMAIQFEKDKKYKKNTVLVYNYDFDDALQEEFFKQKEGSTFSHGKYDYYKMTEKEIKDYIGENQYVWAGTGAILDFDFVQDFLKSKGIM